MKKVTMLEFRRDTEAIIRKVQQGKGMVLTYRGKPVLRLEPIQSNGVQKEKSSKTLLDLCELGERLVPPGPQIALTNDEIDRLVYGL
ncbi:MAG: hypothetical protein SH868_20190 [Bythopirellula sp.]|nr:hypothetical protein [Bythopirellula sp.]